MHMLLILLALRLRKSGGISHLFSIAYAFAGNGWEEAAIKQLLTDMFVVPLDSRLARYAGYLRRLYRLKTPDSAIAATAMLTKTTLLTRNVDDFRHIDDLKIQEI